jgi:hypothetical protein
MLRSIPRSDVTVVLPTPPLGERIAIVAQRESCGPAISASSCSM